MDRSIDAIASELVARMNADDGAGVAAMFGPEMLAAVPEPQTRAFVSELHADAGRLEVTERLDGGARHAEYRLSAARGHDRKLDVELDDEGKIVGIKITPAPPPDPEVARRTVALPFRGAWYVVWGGATRATNPHIGNRSQRRAADLVVRGADGKTHRGDGRRNEDYLVYGKEVLACAPGVVITVIDGVPENVPGVMSRALVVGNAVVVQHAEDLCSLYAHLQPGSARVKVGARVEEGAAIGLCGNSGNSSEPHLHFQLMDGTSFDASWGVEAMFRDVTVTRDGKTAKIAEYAFLKGDLVGDAE